MSESEIELSQIYARRFAATASYRNRVWQILTRSFFSRWVSSDSTVLDLGCGYGEFINNIQVKRKLAMDLNPDALDRLASDVEFLRQDCSERWQVPDNTLDVVFTSNFFEHLPDKNCLKKTLAEAWRCLKPGGRLIAMGPNIKFLPGLYWDFFDHHTILTEASLAEVLSLCGFSPEKVIPRFLPYTMVNAPQLPLFFLRCYLLVPWLWFIKGRQFLVIASKPTTENRHS
jgi:SAM-dependent methyltransferase